MNIKNCAASLNRFYHYVAKLQLLGDYITEQMVKFSLLSSVSIVDFEQVNVYWDDDSRNRRRREVVFRRLIFVLVIILFIFFLCECVELLESVKLRSILIRFNPLFHNVEKWPNIL